MGVIRIATVERKQTQGGKEYLRIQADGVGWLSCWDKTLWPHLEEPGIRVDVDIEQQGQYRSIVALRPGNGALPGKYTPSELLAARQVALTAAVAAVGNARLSAGGELTGTMRDGYYAEVTTLAEEFYSYLIEELPY